ncbi:neuraminidase-like domain-containing protein [Flavilitoribacter nigricans]|uniref:PA14 domain-containing protein n=1 Tax=Flavilitoribacter nigricans (strain ATCC 23147 / DSM 23189 / NBRC 102662 / NCIMB 1420 / SS-2) TaxID=1122177 RepID=A0A2D0MYE0_FLAN2|nr:neuraminidase-like domain-containing protein [Flavilitoribacter nigricans]PHN01148.1 hypothetical protein CRP01_38745 [Flavilitoribacter nigricans DSM 23189 = NBRC 102662]
MKPNYAITGSIADEKGSPIPGILLQAYDQDPSSPPDLLGTTISDENGKYTITYTDAQFRTPKESGGADIIIKVFSPDGKLLKETKRKNNASRKQTININDIDYPPKVEPVITKYTIKGQVQTEKGEAISGLIVELFNQSIPGKPKAALAIGNPIVTCPDGSYEIQIPYQEVKDKCKKDRPDITIKVSNAAGKELFISTQYAIEAEQEIQISIPKTVYGGIPEFVKLNALIQENLDGMDIKAVQENEEVKAISFLAEKTKYNARLVSMSVLAHQYTEEARQNIPKEFYYALFRAGANSNKDALYRMNANAATDLYEKAVKENIIPQNGKTIAELKEAFQAESIRHILNSKPPRGMSTMDAMLSMTITDEREKEDFIAIYYHGDKDKKAIWQQVEEQLGTVKTKKLRLDGQLGFLTFNNAPLIQRLKNERAISEDPVELVKNGYYRKEQWEAIITEKDIPDAITGENIEIRKEQYLAWLTGELRRAYPTKVVAEQVKAQEVTLTNNENIRAEVYDALNRDELGFELGEYSINKHIQELEDRGMPLSAEAKTSLKRMHRVYQLSPRDEDINVLLEKNLDSAFKIVKYDQKQFIERYKSDFGDDEKVAQRVYDKAVADASLITNVTLSYLTQKNNPLPAAVAPMVFNSPAASVKKYPTIENLFGSFDYCGCGHCESVLSPAAYFVELLEFLGGDKFNIPTYNEQGEETGTEKVNAQTLLLRRRPDLEFVELSCENTNTVLPYIDLVNEILEHYVVYNSIAGFTGNYFQPGISPDELLANPQYVKETAYDILKNQVYPLTSPFHGHLDLLRAYFMQLNAPLYKVMEALRKDEQMEPSSGYGWRHIFSEQLNISPKEYHIFTNHKFEGDDSLRYLYGLPANSVLIDTLANAKTFSRAVDISYEDLVAVLRTEFVNPGSRLIPKLEVLQAVFNKVMEENFALRQIYRNHTLLEVLHKIYTGTLNADVTQSLFPPAYYNPSHFHEEGLWKWLQENDTYSDIKSTIFLAPRDPDNFDYCRYEDFDLKYADSQSPDLTDYAFWKLIRFIRLKNKLGWTFEETDRAIAALYNHKQYDHKSGDIGLLDEGFKDLIVKLALFERVEEKLSLNRRRSFQKTLIFFGDINLHGPVVPPTSQNPDLYQQTFLQIATSQGASTFGPNSQGNLLSNPTEKIKNHEEILQGGMKQTAKTLQLLAKKVEFYPTSQATPTILNYDDIPLTVENLSILYRHTILADALKIRVADLLDLIALSGLNPFSGIYQKGGKYVEPDLLKFIELCKQIQKSEFELQDIQYIILHKDISGTSSPLLPEVLSIAKLLGDQLKAIDQKYNHGGELLEEEAEAFLTSIYGPELTNAIYEAFAGQLEQNKLNEIFTFYPELKNIYDAFHASTPEPEKINSTLLALIKEHLNPLLVKLKTVTTEQFISSQLDLTTEQTAQLLNKTLPTNKHFILHAEGKSASPSLTDYLNLVKSGASAHYFYKDVDDPEVTMDVIPNIQLNKSSLPLNANGLVPEKAIWKFYLEAPADGKYHFYVETEQVTGIAVRFFIDGTEIANDSDQNNYTWTNKKDSIQLQAGHLYLMELEIINIKENAILKWQGPGTLVESIPEKLLYPFALVNYFYHSYLRLLKAVRLIEGFALSPETIAYYSGLEDAKNVIPFLNRIPTSQVASNNQDRPLYDRFIELLTHTTARERLQVKDYDLTAILKNASALNEEGEARLFQLLQWDSELFNDLLTHFTEINNVSNLTNNLPGINRVAEALSIIQGLGASVKELLSWATVQPDNEIATALQQFVRSKYDADSWLDVIQPINDKMSGRQRDALVSYVLKELGKNVSTNHIDTPDKLFEYFLIDVQMEPCMKTSRLKQAISSVQLFISRCLMNLETLIPPEILNAKQWDWMKHYRVWEAARKIFLYPENWLDPALRSTKSPFFKEFEGELLQSDINDDSATKALLNYLEKLDKVAWLEICGMCREDEQRIHIIGKSPGMNPVFYHQVNDGSSSAWKKIGIDIEDGIVFQVYWKERLFLFWITIIQKGSDNEQIPETINADNLSTLNGPGKRIMEVNLNWSEYYNDKWQVKRTSDFNDPWRFEIIGEFSYEMISHSFFINEQDELIIQFKAEWTIFFTSRFLNSISYHFYNKYSFPEKKSHNLYAELKSNDFRSRSVKRHEYYNDDPINVTYRIYKDDKILINDDNGLSSIATEITKRPIDHFYSKKVVDFRSALDIYNSPFFIIDHQHVFFVKTKMEQRWIRNKNYFGIEVSSQINGEFSTGQFPFNNSSLQD